MYIMISLTIVNHFPKKNPSVCLQYQIPTVFKHMQTFLKTVTSESRTLQSWICSVCAHLHYVPNYNHTSRAIHPHANSLQSSEYSNKNSPNTGPMILFNGLDGGNQSYRSDWVTLSHLNIITNTTATTTLNMITLFLYVLFTYSLLNIWSFPERNLCPNHQISNRTKNLPWLTNHSHAGCANRVVVQRCYGYVRDTQRIWLCIISGNDCGWTNGILVSIPQTAIT